MSNVIIGLALCVISAFFVIKEVITMGKIKRSEYPMCFTIDIDIDGRKTVHHCQLNGHTLTVKWFKHGEDKVEMVEVDGVLMIRSNIDNDILFHFEMKSIPHIADNIRLACGKEPWSIDDTPPEGWKPDDWRPDDGCQQKETDRGPDHP